jgi:O-antigen/teichoic acid export membrane protein
MRERLSVLGELLLGREESASLRHRLLAGVAGLLSLRVAFGALAFGVTVVLARVLGRAGVGNYNFALAWVTLLGAPAILGLDQLLVREIPAFTLRSDWGLVRGIVTVANRIVLGTSACLIIGTLVVAWFLRDSTPIETLRTLAIATILIPVIALTRLRQATLQSFHRAVVGAVPERLIIPGLLLVFLEAGELTRTSVTAPFVMVANVVACCVALVVGARLLQRQFPAEARSATPAYLTRSWIREAIPIFLLGSVSVVFSQADVLILGSLTGAAIVGPYSIADRSADLLTVVMVAQNAAFASTAASLYSAGDVTSLQRLTTRIARLTVLGTLPAAVVFIGFGHWFLSFFYGAEFGGAWLALLLLSVGQLVNIGAGLNGMLLVMTGQTQSAVRVVGISALINVVLNFVCVPRWGMDGAALANMISLIVWNVLATLALYRTTGIHSTVFGRLATSSTDPS